MNKQIIKILNDAYWRLPWRWRDPLVDLCYGIAGPLFRGVGHYEHWRRTKSGLSSSHQSPVKNSQSALLLDLKRIPLCEHSPGRIAVHAHIFYPDLVKEFATHLNNIPYNYDLYVSIADEAARKKCEASLAKLKRLEKLTIVVVANRGRDIAPFIVTFGQSLREYDFVCHIHTKKSLYNRGKTDGWREYLLEGLLGSEKRVRQIFSLLAGDENVGMVYPQNCARVPYYANTWLANRGSGEKWCTRLGIHHIPRGYFHFPVGSMFWARSSALRPLFDAEIRLEDFEAERGQTDGTLAHCIERLLGLVPIIANHRLAIIRDNQSLSWSPWRFDQYLMRTIDQASSIINSPNISLVIFDIFDTLLTRPLLNPESGKSLVAHRAGRELGSVYLRWRVSAETQARQRAGKDVDLVSIYEEFSRLSKLPPKSVESLCELEQAVEADLVSARPDGIDLYQRALASGKRVVLASDMYLSKSTIESMLERSGIANWSELYLSSDIGFRKDSGKLFQHILSTENVSPANALMVGDNERSDLQIPADMGLATLHLMRPVELARALPRTGQLIESTSQAIDINAELALGMIVQRAYAPLFYPSSFNPLNFVPASPATIGYSVAGPMLVAFVDWLVGRAKEDNVRCLFFLSREGQILKSVYDRWTATHSDAPVSEYLVVSRRTVTVPMLQSMDDIFTLARKEFFSNRVEIFIQSRYGLTLSSSEWSEIHDLGIWKKGASLKIQNSQIAHVEPLLVHLAPKIFDQAASERPALIKYLNEKGLQTSGKLAVVDVGYSGTIQAGLNRLIDNKVHGYYMLTDQEIETLIREHGVVGQGAYYHAVPAEGVAPAMLRQSFVLEKLLSSDDAQVIRYLSDQAGCTPEFALLSDAEKNANSLRAEIRRGVDEYISDALAIRGKLYSEFSPSLADAEKIFSIFVNNMTNDEKEIINGLSLDDHYCGRGVN